MKDFRLTLSPAQAQQVCNAWALMLVNLSEEQEETGAIIIRKLVRESYLRADVGEMAKVSKMLTGTLTSLLDLHGEAKC